MVRALAIFCLAATLVQGARILTMSPGTDAAMPDASKGKGKGKAAQPPPLAGKGKGKPPPPASAAKPKGPPVRIKTAGGGLDLANFKGLRRTNNLEQLEARATEQGVNKAPIDIKDAVFVNPSTSTPAVESIPELFAKWPQTKLLLVDFFAFSCTNCIRAGRTIGDIYERYHDHGLRVLAFARPEFTFEGDTREVLSWARRNNIKYSVATDAMGTNWRSWKVDSWPTHFLVQEDPRQEHKGEYVISYMHVGDRNSHELYNKVIQLLKLPDAPVPGINTVGYTDVEVFLGLGFRHKNIGEEECSETKACRGPALGPMADASNVQELPRPKDGDFTVYGTEFCIWCRRTKTLLELSGASFTYIDVQDFGGKVIVYDKLGLPRKGHETMPAVYGLDGNLLGGFAEVKTFFPEVDVQDVIDATPEVKVSAATVYQKLGARPLYS
eukprot:TRINITY_DN20205_c0_g1_i1.p1 TRINITY_DN20205_c0_g1~~TRINITY_DN20205_c0_g1_i1.p1  ORF type:complete len:440 (+),score=57.56 TRINITY_DN20205_c0_g1_i1:143-1462(+)